MSYNLGQYIYTNKGLAPISDSTTFMTPITNGSAKIRNVADSNFTNPCVTVNNNFEKNTNYYFHGKVKAMASAQTYSIKLVKYNDSNSKTQFIKKVVISGTSQENWVDVSFNFNPLVNDFDTILFELVRIDEDYISPRVPIIIYEELDIVNNTSILNNEETYFIKIGIQAEPGSNFIINGENIKIGNSGLFSFENQDVPIYFFSAVSAATETLTYPTESVCLFSSVSGKKREIKTFILDYIYEY